MIVSIIFIFFREKAFRQTPEVTARSLIIPSDSRLSTILECTRRFVIILPKGMIVPPFSPLKAFLEFFTAFHVDRINLLLSGNAIKNIPLIIIDEIRGICSFPMVEAPKKDLCPHFVDISQILDVFCFLDIWIESG